MLLKKCLLTENLCYKRAEGLIPRGVCLHSTGANNPLLRRYVQPDDGLLGVNQNGNHWNQRSPDGRLVCVHAFIGKLKDGSIATYQTLPFTFRGWHGGSGKNGSVNNSHIGFEICEGDLDDATYFRAVYKEAVEFTAYLCKRFNLDPLQPGVVICHSEGAARGIASHHADVMHWFPRHGKSMDTFRHDVATLLEGEEDMNREETEKIAQEVFEKNTVMYPRVTDIPAWGRPVVDKLINRGAVQVTADGHINMSYDLLRTLVINDRMGIYGR